MSKLAIFTDDLPDYHVLSQAQAAEVTNLSDDTLKRLHRQGQGPPRVQLSTRRVGYTVGGLRNWLQKRSSE